MMFKGLKTLRSDDAGFTVVEVVIAASILFFTLTALIGLMGVSTNMSAGAKSRAVLSNEISSEMDRVRSLPFDQIGLKPAGALDPSVTFVRDGFTCTFVYTVTLRSNGTKEVRVDGTATRDGFPPVSSSAFAAIRNRVGATGGSAAGAPTIRFDNETPDGDTIVSANRTEASDALVIAATAEAIDEHTISRIEFKVGSMSGGNVPLRDGNTIYAHTAEFDYPGAPNAMESESFVWHTGQVDDAGQALVADGRRAVRITAYDEQGRPSAPRERSFIVDNFVPAVPTNRTLALDARADLTQAINLTWTKALDGTLEAPYHEAELYEDRATYSDMTAWTRLAVLQNPGSRAADGFARYAMRVKALSPLRNASAWGSSNLLYTRPPVNGSCDLTRYKQLRANGSYSNSLDTWKFTTRFTIPKPRYPYSAVTVEVLRNGVAMAAPTTAQVTAAWNTNQPYSFSDVFSQDISKSSLPTAPAYQVRVVITPTGYGAGTPETLLSNTARPYTPANEDDFQYTTGPLTSTNLPLTVAW